MGSIATQTTQHSINTDTADEERSSPLSLTGGLFGTEVADTGSTVTTSELRDPPHVVEVDSLHEEAAAFLGPLPWPPPPSRDAQPLDIAIWLGTILLNTSPNQPSATDLIAPLLAQPLANEFAAEPPPLAVDQGDAASSRAELVDAWIEETTETNSRVDAVLVFEQTCGRDDAQMPGFRFVYLDVTLALDNTSWVVTALTISTS